MFDFLRVVFNVGIPEPKVGTILVDKVWGEDYTKLEITRVSEDKKEVMYRFLMVEGEKATSGSIYSGTWRFLCADSYKILGD